MRQKFLLGLTLSKFNLELSKTEALLCFKAYFEVEEFLFVSNHLFFFVSGDSSDIVNCLNRLAFTKECFVVSSKKDWVFELVDFCKIFNLPYGKEVSFSVVPFMFNNRDSFVENVASTICDENLAGRVHLSKPDLIIGGFESLNLFGVLIWSNKDSFIKRRVHLKPKPHPSGIDPRLARAMINLASAKEEVLDPFCGAGGILEEVKLIGLKYIGVDISWKMINLARINLGSRENLFKMDALSWDSYVECVVTDLPYGKSCILDKEFLLLADNFLSYYKNYTNKIVVCAPNSYDLVSIAKKHGWALDSFFDVYVHGSLTRRLHIFSI